MIDTGLTKEELNKQIVLLRTHVKKARPFEVSGMLRKMKKLHKSSSSQNNTGKKNEEKLARLMLEIGEMKKLKFDEVAKFALLNETTFSEVMRKGSFKERAMIRLAENASVKRQVTAFRAKYPKWKIEIPSIFHIWSFNKKVFGDKKKKKIRVSSGPEENAKSSPTIQIKAMPSSFFTSKSRSSMKSATTKKKPATNTSMTKLSGEAESEELTDYQLSDDSEGGPDEAKEISSGRRPTLSQLSQIMKATMSEDLRKTDGEIEVKRIKMSEIEDEIPISVASKPKCHSEDTPVMLGHKVSSSFFIDASVSVPDDSASEKLVRLQDDDSDDLPELHSKYNPKSKTSSNGGKKRGRFQFGNTDRRQSRSSQSIRIKPLSGSSRLTHHDTKFNRKPRSTPEALQPESTVSSEPIHPSWAAKRKQTAAISDFKGVKLKFEDSE